METIRLNETDKYVTFGRTVTNNDGMALFWAGSGLEMNVLAGCLYVNIECSYDNSEIMLDIILDGERTQKIVLDKGNDADWFGSTWVCWMTFFAILFILY